MLRGTQQSGTPLLSSKQANREKP